MDSKSYGSASFNDKMLGHGEPVRVREGERVLFRLLNASATENINLALPHHRFNVVALDGNPVPSSRAVDTLMFGTNRTALPPDHQLELLFEKIVGGRGGYNRWTLNGKSWPNANPLLSETGKRIAL
jgi:Multicopper oxidase